MRGVEHFWAILLAAGEGERVRSLTNDGHGRHVPKQFWSLDGRDSLLRLAMRRAECLVPRHRVVPVVAAQHRHWWGAELQDLPPGNVVVQPRNKGTSAGILLPLAHVLRTDPWARVVILPTDHVVRREEILARSMVAGARAVLADPQRVVLLGMVPQGNDQEYGWIMPAGTAAEREPLGVQAFMEKPDQTRARLLAQQGGLLNSFIMVAAGGSLLQLFQEIMPHVASRFLYGHAHCPVRPGILERLYRSLPKSDFSRDILEASCHRLSVIPVPDCGWADVGTPARLRPLLDGRPGEDAGLADTPLPPERRPPKAAHPADAPPPA
jgi:mannose-1-phosphate guanylyltransferase